MKIESSSVELASQHASSRLHTVDESLRMWTGTQRPNTGTGGLPDLSTRATLSDQGRRAAARDSQMPPPMHTAKSRHSHETDDASDTETDPKLRALIGLIESLTGHKVRLLDLSSMEANQAPTADLQPTTASTQPQNWGVEYDRHESLHESETTQFNAQGIIKTSDGKEINFNLSLDMKREFSQESSVSLRMGNAVKKDPLVINFAGNAAQLTDTKFSFDLDSNGQSEQISFVGAGSGFLTLDKNGNGSVDNGSELFGTQSGNGFADLAAYDSDGNHWIDENDDVYSQLRVWSKDADGKDQISTLAQRNVGALYLGNVATPFDLKNSANDLQGQIRSSGVYLTEDGAAGTLQQVDLVV